MKKTVTTLFFLSIIFLSSPIFSQVIFSDDFESGAPCSEWGLFWEGEDGVTAIEMGNALAPLATGGNYVGSLIDLDTSYTGAAMAVSGDVGLSNYSIEADVYCYVNDPNGSAYTGLVVYADSSVNTYIKMVADFDASQRIRLYNNKLDMTTFQYSFSHDFVAADIPGGIPTTDGWHKMKVEVRTLNEDTTAFWCYFDGQELAGNPIYDTGKDRMPAGRFGLFSFQMGNPLNGYFDNIISKPLEPIVSVDGRSAREKLPQDFALEQNYPNPFNPTTNISYQIKTSGHVSLVIYDVLGKKVQTLVSENQAPGYYTVTWNGRNDFGSKVNSGVYLYTLRTGQLIESKKMILMK